MSDNGPDMTAIASLIQQIDTLGFFRYVKPDRIESVKKLCIKTPSLRAWARRTKRDYPADEERLAECGVGEFLKSISPVLRASGVKHGRIKERCGAEGYAIAISGVWYELYSAADVRAANEHESIVMWEKTTRRSFALINRLFREHASDERIYSWGGWNDHWAFILTEALYAALRESDLGHELDGLILYDDSRSG